MKKRKVAVIKFHKADNLKVLKRYPDNHFSSVVTDPPYGLSFMGKKWDYDVPSVEIWEECLRILKPGGFLLSFAGTRTYHRMVVNIEDAGFEIRDMVSWVYGSGFPKSHNVSNAIDKKMGCSNRGHAISSGNKIHPTTGKPRPSGDHLSAYQARTKEGKVWKGWGTALKPAFEPIVVARKPLSEKTVAANVLKWGTGGINIDGCRVGTNDIIKQSGELVDIERGKIANGYDRKNSTMFRTGKPKERGGPANTQGRFPANLIHDSSDEVEKGFPHTNSGSASRFFYCAKASKAERNLGCEEIEKRKKVFNGQSKKKSKLMKGVEQKFSTKPASNFHPTVKPIKLMEYLVKLVTPPKGIVLDPFLGSGTTAIACRKLGFGGVGIEREKEYYDIACKRIKAYKLIDNKKKKVKR